ncbi:ribonuclease III [Candidatus Peregrinibacteria bacterium HGW-Peregrinibacteria-1]|nr:MAG: ribonuclease III [Candidatus Peregrinibacteria bacterium HGW-Peregrinibacteria-1]
MQRDFTQLEKRLNLKFSNLDRINQAFIHKSYVNEYKTGELANNERLEFLGDAVLELVSTKHLFTQYPHHNEGDMTAYRSALVKGKHLAQVARELGIGEYLFLSRGEERSGGREKSYILANTMEALIGAVYLDEGYEAAEKMIQTFILTQLDNIISEGLHIDAKSHLQELSQERENFTPYYELIKQEGPDHDKIFTMGVYIKDNLIAQGKGSSKQKAENSAAENALEKLQWNNKQ